MLFHCGAGEDSWDSWTTRRSNQSILKEINPEYSLEGLMLKLRLPYFGHLMQRNNSLKKILMSGKVEGRRKGLLKMRYLDSITNLVDMSLSKFWEMMKNRESWCAAVHVVTKSWTQLGDWPTTNKVLGLPRWLSGKESTCRCQRGGLSPWVQKTPWRRKWQPIPVFLPGESHGQRSLVGYSPRGHKEWDTTEWLN